MTEEEAKTKRCHNPSPWVLEYGGWCIASDCMMWRWDHECHPSGEFIVDSKDLGYCGLAK